MHLLPLGKQFTSQYVVCFKAIVWISDWVFFFIFQLFLKCVSCHSLSLYTSCLFRPSPGFDFNVGHVGEDFVATRAKTSSKWNLLQIWLSDSSPPNQEEFASLRQNPPPPAFIWFSFDGRREGGHFQTLTLMTPGIGAAISRPGRSRMPPYCCQVLHL